MCATCGCGSDAKTTLLDLETGSKTTLGEVAQAGHEHVLADGTRVWHSHGHDHAHADHDHSHHHGHDRHHHHSHDVHDHGHTVSLEARVLAKNDARAHLNRAWLAGREILALNLMSAPGAGKTTLLERTIRDFASKRKLFVIEGDQATANDGERIRAAGAPAVQVNTGTGCHLDAEMIAHGLDKLKPAVGSLLFIENVGNLVCPALFDLGETARVAILSVTEGDDKPIKYPHMFRAADLVLMNKTDLLPHVDFSVERASALAREVNPAVEVLTLSARTGEGLGDWYDWLSKRHAQTAT